MEYILDNSSIILQVKSDLTASKVRDMVDFTKNLISEKKDLSEVVLDISNSKTIDSIGITFIIGIYKSALNYGKTFKITGANKEIKQLFTLMKLNNIFEF